MTIPNNARGSDFRTGTHDGARINGELDRLYANDSDLQVQAQNAGGIASAVTTEVAEARGGEPTLKSKMDSDSAALQVQLDPLTSEVTAARNGQATLLNEILILEAARAEIIAARASASQGDYASLDARIEAIDSRITAALSAVQGAAEVVEARTDLAGTAWPSLRDSINHGARDIMASAIAKIVATSAAIVDVKLYDTSKGSDGGAWRKRCQNTSWYNETLNTATRGATRGFPAIAMIVAEATKVTIYDATDPMLPMWKVSPAMTAVKSVAAVNGKLLVGDSTDGLFIYDFIAVTSQRYTSAGNRKAAGIFATLAAPDSGTRIVNTAVYAVAATILPSAPIDPLTGLPVPTVDVFAAGGISRIKHDGTVVSSASVGNLFKGGQTIEGLPVHASYDAIRALKSDLSYTEYYRNAGYGFQTGRVHYIGAQEVPKAFVSKENLVAHGGTPGLSIFLDNAAGRSKSLVNYTTKDYASGWLPGDIRGAWLADSVAETVTGAELVTNGTFDTDTIWTKEVGWTIAGGKATHAVGAASNLYETGPLVVGNQYSITIVVTDYVAGSLTPFVGSTTAITPISGAGTFTLVIVCAGAANLGVRSSSDFNGSIDSISVKLLNQDRSAKAKGLSIFGSLTKTPVATGSELVAYSGFFAANYLEQPYNADLDFGTAAFAFLLALREASNIADEVIFERAYYTGGAYSGASIRCLVLADGKLRAIFSDGTNSATITSTAAIDDSTWKTGIVVGYDGTNFRLLSGGVDLATPVARGSVGSLNNTSAILRVGLGVDGNSPLTNGSLALLRATAMWPSADQLAFIYDQERKLFEADAKCLLGGTSNTVQALAFDEDSDLLYVGTPDGMSTFQGLRSVAYVQKPAGSSGSANIKAIAAGRGGVIVGTAAEAYFTLPSANLREPLIARTLPISAPKITPTLTNSWIDYIATDTALAPVRYWKDAGGIVRLEGAVGAGTNGTIALTLPPGYRPNGKRNFATVTNTGAGSVTISAAGAVTPAAGGTTWNSLDGIAFLAEA